MIRIQRTKKEIMDDLKSQLKKIRGIGFVEFQRVSAGHREGYEFPGIYINDASVDRTKTKDGYTKNVWGIQIIGWVQERVKGNLWIEMNTFIEAIEEKLKVPSSRGYSISVESISTDSGTKYPQAMFVMNLLIEFFSRE